MQCTAHHALQPVVLWLQHFSVSHLSVTITVACFIYPFPFLRQVSLYLLEQSPHCSSPGTRLPWKHSSSRSLRSSLLRQVTLWCWPTYPRGHLLLQARSLESRPLGPASALLTRSFPCLSSSPLSHSNAGPCPSVFSGTLIRPSHSLCLPLLAFLPALRAGPYPSTGFILQLLVSIDPQSLLEAAAPAAAPPTEASRKRSAEEGGWLPLL